MAHQGDELVMIGQAYSAVPPPDFPEQASIVRGALEALGRDVYRPLWLTKHWKTGNGGVIRTVHHVLGHYDPHPKSERWALPNLLLPTFNLYGLDWRAPLFEDDVLDGLTDDERSNGVLPRYQPLDWTFIKHLRKGAWEDRNEDTEEHIRRRNEHMSREAQKAERQTNETYGYAFHHDRTNTLDDGSKPPTIAREFVSHTLVKAGEGEAA